MCPGRIFGNDAPGDITFQPTTRPNTPYGIPAPVDRPHVRERRKVDPYTFDDGCEKCTAIAGQPKWQRRVYFWHIAEDARVCDFGWWKRRRRRGRFELTSISVSPCLRVESRCPADQSSHASFNLLLPVRTTWSNIVSCSLRYCLPSAVIRYGCRRDPGLTARIHPRWSRRVIAPYKVPGPSRMPANASMSCIMA